jgi:hypothetical protein
MARTMETWSPEEAGSVILFVWVKHVSLTEVDELEESHWWYGEECDSKWVWLLLRYCTNIY